MFSITFNPLICQQVKNNLLQAICLSFLYSISCNLAAEEQVDLLTTEPVLTYSISHATLSDNDSLKIKIYSDGYALLHYPAYMKKAGDYSVYLSHDEFQHLIQMLDTPDLRNFNARISSLQRKAREKANGTVSFVSDSSYSSFEVSRSDEYGNNKTTQKINSPHLQFDAKAHPESKAFKHLAEVETLLNKLINQSGVQEVSR